MSEIDKKNAAIFVIAGGKSSRMGRDKRWLDLGGRSMLERCLRRIPTVFSERFLMVEANSPDIMQLAENCGFCIVTDEVQGRGPVEGLRLGLKHMSADWGLALSADMPFFSFSAIEPLFIRLSEIISKGERRIKCILPTLDGRRQPLAGLYHKGLLTEIAQKIKRGERKLGAMAEAFETELVDIHRYTEQKEYFFNVNTKYDYRLASGRAANEGRKVPQIAVVAPVAGTGKTTFLEKLTARLSRRGIRVAVVKSDAHGFSLDTQGKDSARLSRRGIRVAVVKSDAHGFSLDTQGKDSARFRASGACAVSVVSPKGYFLEEATRLPFDRAADKFEKIDLILTESRTHAACPAFSLWRGRGEPILGNGVTALFAGEKLSEAAADIAGEKGISIYPMGDIDRAELLTLFLSGVSFQQKSRVYGRNAMRGNEAGEEIVAGKREPRLSHFDRAGEAVMVDVGDKAVTHREAVASGILTMNEAAFSAIQTGTAKKGDVLGIARIAGIMAAKRTSEAIPLCHPLFLTKCKVAFALDAAKRAVKVTAAVKCEGKTGVEMEALHSVTIALLTIYDMLKAVDRRMEIHSVHLEQKSGGKSGSFSR